VVESARHTGYTGEAIGVNGVHANGDAVKAGILERLSHVGEEMAVRGDGNIERLARRSAEHSEIANVVNNASAQQGLTAGETNLCDSHSHQNARHAQIIGKRQFPIKRAFISSPAINAFVITAVGDGNPQVGYGAAEFVGEKQLLAPSC
jgi:hypothetical protein